MGHVQLKWVTQYLRHPSTWRAETWCVLTCSWILVTHKISAQSVKRFLRYGWFLKFCFITIENPPYLRNHLSNWAEILCVTRIHGKMGTHQISALQVNGCRRYWVTNLSCTWPLWPSFQCIHYHIFTAKNSTEVNIHCYLPARGSILKMWLCLIQTCSVCGETFFGW